MTSDGKVTEMQSFRATAVVAALGAALVVAAACGRTSGVAATTGPVPERTSASSSSSSSASPTTTGDSRGCPQPDASRPDRRPTVAIMYFDNGALTNRTDYAPLSKG